jgi:hypothetical protein
MDNRSILLDLIKHTAGLGIFENVKITGTADETRIDAMDTDRTVILNAKLHDPAADFAGEYGMGNLGLLSSLTRLSNYSSDEANVEIVRAVRNEVEVPTTIVFQDDAGSKDQYRFMSKEIVDQLLKVATFRGANWKVEVAPSNAKVTQLSEVATIYSGIEPTFSVKTEDDKLVFIVGSDTSGALGRRVFAEGIDGTLDSTWSWNLPTFLSIVKLGMTGNCMVRFSDAGACQIDVDSGIGYYSYILPAISK